MLKTTPLHMSKRYLGLGLNCDNINYTIGHVVPYFESYLLTLKQYIA